MLEAKLTAEAADVHHIANDLLADVLGRLFPGQLQAAGAQRHRPQTGRSLGQFGPLAEGQPSAGLVGAGAVLGDALVDGLVLGRDARDSQRPAGGDRETLIATVAALLLVEDKSHSSHVLPLVSLTLPLGASSLPFFSQMRCGSGTPDAVQLKTALPPAGLETD